MYLLTVAVAEEDGHTGDLPMAALAETLAVSSASANEMVRKLAARRLVEYEPYQGVRLTDTGRGIAHRVLRIRRLWGTFLHDHVGMAAGDADALACRLEHVTSAEAAAGLARFLGDPPKGPMGRPIPAGEEAPPPPEAGTLLDHPLGSPLEIVDIAAEAETRGFLTDHGVELGATVIIEARGENGLLLAAGPSRLRLATDLGAAIRAVAGGD